MGLVDVVYEAYGCPHCPGHIVVRKQFPHDGTGCSTTVQHVRCDEVYSGTELKEKKVDARTGRIFTGNPRQRL